MLSRAEFRHLDVLWCVVVTVPLLRFTWIVVFASDVVCVLVIGHHFLTHGSGWERIRQGVSGD